VPSPENIVPNAVVYGQETIYELSEGDGSGISYAKYDDYIVISSSSQIVKLALLAASDTSQRYQNSQYLRCSGNSPYRYIMANDTVNLENSSQFLNIMPETALPANKCI
jgi:hypothetical protein